MTVVPPDPGAVRIHSPRDAYDLVAPTYHLTKWYGFWRANETPVIRAWLPKSGRLVVDLGGGSAPYLKDLQDAFAQQVIVDLSYGMLRQAQKQARRLHDPMTSLVQADLLALPLASRSADAILCTRVLSHVASLPQAFREIARVLKPAGRLLITDVHADHPYSVTRFETEGRSVYVETHKHTLHDVIGEAVAAGLTLERADEYTLKNLQRPPDPIAFAKLYRSTETPIFYSVTLHQS